MKIKKGENMRHQFAELSKQDKEFHEMVLLEEIDIQTWYAVAYSTILGQETFLTLQLREREENMKTLAAPAIMMVPGLIPYFMRSGKPELARTRAGLLTGLTEEELRYDINDFYGTGTEIE